MALQGCYGCLKWLVFFVNLIFWLAGVTLLGLSIWLLFDIKMLEGISTDPVSYSVGTYILLGAGACMTVVGFLGCCGAMRESQCLLGSFFVFLMIILVAQITAAVWVYQNTDELEKRVRNSVKETVTKSYSATPTNQNEAFDAVQQSLKCCGYDGPQSWAYTAYNGKSGSNLGIGATLTGAVSYQIPSSCCANPKSDVCEATRKTGLLTSVASSFDGIIYSQGCSDSMVKLIKDYFNIVLIVAIAVGVVEVLGMICSMLLCCAVRKIDDYKA